MGSGYFLDSWSIETCKNTRSLATRFHGLCVVKKLAEAVIVWPMTFVPESLLLADHFLLFSMTIALIAANNFVAISRYTLLSSAGMWPQLSHTWRKLKADDL